MDKYFGAHQLSTFDGGVTAYRMKLLRLENSSVCTGLAGQETDNNSESSLAADFTN